MAAPAFRVLGAFYRAVTCIGAKRVSMLIHTTAIKNGNIPPVRGVTGLPYGGLRYIKSKLVDSPGPGGMTPRLVVSSGNVYSG